MNDFYVGYLPKAPTGLARFVRKVVIALGLLAVTAALALLAGQMPFANSAFEYGKVSSFEGVVVTRPFPTLLVLRPGDVGRQDKYSRYLLVAPGKHYDRGWPRWQTCPTTRTTDLSRGAAWWKP